VSGRRSPWRSGRACPSRIWSATGTSLAEHLTEQRRLATNEERTFKIGEYIIGNLDDDGYLRAEVEEIAHAAAVSVQEVETEEGIPASASTRSTARCSGGRATRPSSTWSRSCARPCG